MLFDFAEEPLCQGRNFDERMFCQCPSFDLLGLELCPGGFLTRRCIRNYRSGLAEHSCAGS